MNILYVAVGGAIGSVARYLMMMFAGQALGDGFPYGTVIVNITGSFLMGILIGLLARQLPEHAAQLRIFFAVGILGGYTTFSSFSLDAIAMMEQGRLMSMTIYILASIICSLGGLYAGLQLIRVWA